MQVSLLNQEVIIERIQSAVESKLRSSNDMRTFQEQVYLKALSENRKVGLQLVIGNNTKPLRICFFNSVLCLISIFRATLLRVYVQTYLNHYS